MSLFVSQPVPSASPIATGHLSESMRENVHGQRHDRITDANSSGSGMGTAGQDDDDQPDIEITHGQKMLSAVSGSILTSLLATPLDVVRVRLQSQRPPPSIPDISKISQTLAAQSFNKLPPNLGVTACCREVFWLNNNAQFCVAGANISVPSSAISTNAPECAVEEAQRKTFNSTFDGLRKIAKNEGITTLWRGLSPTLLMAVPANVIYFTGYDALRSSKYSPLKDRVPESYAPLIAGATARVCAAVVVSPIEMFRTRLQAAHHSHTPSGLFKETLSGLHEMVHTQGYTSLWRGLTLTFWRDVPFSGIYWWGYETCRNWLIDARELRASHQTPLSHSTDASEDTVSRTRRRSRSRSHENGTATWLDSFIAGAASGAVASLVTTPFDVGKTRQQVIRHSGDLNSSSFTNRPRAPLPQQHALQPEERSMPRFLWHIFQTEGLAGLFRGWAARCLKVAPACAIMISSYEIGKKVALGMNERHVEKKMMEREMERERERGRARGRPAVE
ncbi:MAG: hypothetical protein M1819_002672 [Sarea resinae]|nr:MAG: hypothetical protein M1819_002672 [Sarea resinae]